MRSSTQPFIFSPWRINRQKRCGFIRICLCVHAGALMTFWIPLKCANSQYIYIYIYILAVGALEWYPERHERASMHTETNTDESAPLLPVYSPRREYKRLCRRTHEQKQEKLKMLAILLVK
uniref:Uncharacterized protein n=1 Tax=Schistocephalus solidus TaxID=70667 RepID=A0A0X3PDK0_SCHSO